MEHSSILIIYTGGTIGMVIDKDSGVLHPLNLDELYDQIPVLETYGSGNAMVESWFIESLKKAIDTGIIILNVSQCISGSVEMGKYQTSVKLGDTGVLSGYDISTESALAKMMYLFGEGFSNDEVKKLLLTPLRGEMTIRQI